MNHISKFYTFNLLKNNDTWIGNLRERIKSKFLNGTDVTWPSFDLLKPIFTVNNVEKLGAYAAEGALMEYISDEFKKRYITKHFTIGFDFDERKDKCRNGSIYWNCINIGRFWYCDTSDGKDFGPLQNNKWVFNCCILIGYFGEKRAYESLQEMLLSLEKTFPHEKYQKYLNG